MKLFGSSKPGHPLADPKEAKRLLEALPADEVKALDEVMHWMESVAAIEGFKPEARIQLLFMLDDAAQVRVRKLSKDYFAAGRPSRYQENRLWTALHGFWRQAGHAYARQIDQFVQGHKGVDAAKALLPLLLVRTLRSFAQHIKWMHMHYGPIEAGSWGVFNSVYAFAEIRQLALSRVAVYAGAAGESTPQLEFLKGAMFSISTPDGLLPLEIELAERLVGALAPRFVLSSAPGAGVAFSMDLAQALPPLRLARAPKTGPTVRCFGPGAALAEVHDLAEKVHVGGKIPPDVNLGGTFEPHLALDVMRHLHICWSAEAPERKTQRHAVKSRLSVTHGYDGVVAVLGGGDTLDFDNQNSESWIVENVSAGGFGAVVPQVKGDWLRVGTLVALQPEGGSNWVLGLVRRVNKLAGQQARAGIQTLSKSPQLSRFSMAGVKTISEQGLLLKIDGAAEVHIVLKPGVFTPGQNLEMAQGERHHVYLPQAVAERGEDYEISRFRELIRES